MSNSTDWRLMTYYIFYFLSCSLPSTPSVPCPAIELLCLALLLTWTLSWTELDIKLNFSYKTYKNSHILNYLIKREVPFIKSQKVISLLISWRKLKPRLSQSVTLPLSLSSHWHRDRMLKLSCLQRNTDAFMFKYFPP